MARLYALLALIGAIAPLAAFLPWLTTHGFDLALFAHELFVNRISSFFALDVIVSAIVLFCLIAIEGRRLGIARLWLPVLATCLIGVSCGLPLFLMMRERRLAGA